MTNGTKLTNGNHLESVSVNAKRYILAELLTLTNAITAELNLKADDEVFSAGASGIVPAPTAGDTDKFLRGNGQWATPTVIIGTASSTVEGGLWFEFKDGLPIVKMNYNGGDFLIDTHFDGDNVIVGDVLFFDGHRFKLTGFADALTFSDNNFYAAGNLVGSVSNFAFQFTDAAALSVAEGDTISITQLDTDVVDFSLDLTSLNTTPKPWYFGTNKNPFTEEGKYTYKTGTGTSYRKTGDATYINSSSNSDAQTLTLILSKNLFPTQMNNGLAWNGVIANKNKAGFAAEDFTYVTVDEIYDSSGSLKEFVVTIKSDDALKQDRAISDSDWLNEIKITSTKKDIDGTTDVAGAKVTVKFDGTSLGYSSHTEGSLTQNNDKTYTFATDTYIDGYTADSNTEDNVATLTRKTDVPSNIQGDKCTIEGLADNLSIQWTEPHKYNIYKDATLDENGKYLSGGTQVGTISYGKITIIDQEAFADVKEGVVATVKDTEGQKDTRFDPVAYQIDLSDDLKTPTTVLEGFTYNNGTYTYLKGSVTEHFTKVNPTPGSVAWAQSNSVSYVPAKTIQTIGVDTENFSMTISGLPDFGDLVIVNSYIYKSSEVTTTDGVTTANSGAAAIGYFALWGIDVGTLSHSFIQPLADAGYPTITLGGNNDYKLAGRAPYKTYAATYSNDNVIDFGVNTYYLGYSVSDDGKTATYHRQGLSYKRIYLTPPSGYKSYSQDNNATAVYWRPFINAEEYEALSDDDKTDYWQYTTNIYFLRDESSYILFAEFNGQDWVLNSHALDNMSIDTPINITDIVNSTPINFNFDLATDADTAAISRTFANETFTAGATAGTYTYTATGTTAGWNVSADGSKIASFELQGKTFTIENLRTDLGNLGFDSQGYIHATNGSTIGRMGGNVIKLYDTAVHKLATPILTGTDAADFTLILPS